MRLLHRTGLLVPCLAADSWPASPLPPSALRGERRHRYPLAAVAEAHRDLEGRRTIGPPVLLP
jgi:hypothetical protein